jgi:hypothetical protein
MGYVYVWGSQNVNSSAMISGEFDTPQKGKSEIVVAPFVAVRGCNLFQF